MKFPFGPDVEGNTYEMEVKEKGISWRHEIPPTSEELAAAEAKGKKAPKSEVFKSTMNFNTIATVICRDWWDMSRNPPISK
jgi:hypothetical protein